MKKLEKILAENMRRFGTKNLNERISSYDEKTLTLGGRSVTLLDGIGGLTAADAINTAKNLSCRLLTIAEVQEYLKQSGNYPAPDERFPANTQRWRAFIQDESNPNNPILWDLIENKEAPKAMPATRFLGIQNM